MFSLCPDDIGVLLTYRCVSECAHCLYNCGPRHTAVMTTDTLREALEALAVYPQRPQVHLTGGEPFLYYPLLLEGVRMASERGIWVYVETSAAWCTDEEEAAIRFAELREAGLQSVLISCSPFHAVRIPPERTLCAIRAAQQVLGADRVMVYQRAFMDLMRRFGETRPTPLVRYEETYGLDGAKRLLWDGYGIIPGGRAGYRLGYLVRRQPPEAFADQDCAWPLLYAQHSHMDLHGNFIPAFCGGLAVGDWHQLPQLLAEFQGAHYPPLIALLAERGPYGLFGMAQERYGYRPLEEGYVGKCHLCVDVRRWLVTQTDFPELCPAEFYDNF